MRRAWLVFLLLLCAPPAQAQIAFDAATDGGNNGGGTTSLTFSHTTSGSDRLLVACIAGDTVNVSSDDLSSVTYNGVAMTFGTKNITAGGNRNDYLYYLVAPASGAHNVVVTMAGVHYILAGAVSYTGVNATGQPDSTNTTSGNQSGVTATDTVVTANAWVVTCETNYSGNPAPTAGSGATRRTYDAAFGTWGAFDSGAAVSAGSYSLTINRSAADSNSLAATVAFAPTAGAAATVPPCNSGLFLFGVGCGS